MEIRKLTMERKEDFVAYCKKHRMDIDDSYLYDEDLRDFEPNDDNPTYIVVNPHGEIMRRMKGKGLYIQEGFKQVEAVVCYKYDLTRP
ncbi:hypothetical protein [Paenibacillus alkalitolerans]|uniref:hypothetical protein n=1 Tax=Paenibacillus alkalitolerans TaxID=2799335 RepID=UPI0018F7B037|nr:hypothetical protein [Paenibacillus alkalitolerans]